jgi:hypothetical protein
VLYLKIEDILGQRKYQENIEKLKQLTIEKMKLVAEQLNSLHMIHDMAKKKHSKIILDPHLLIEGLGRENDKAFRANTERMNHRRSLSQPKIENKDAELYHNNPRLIQPYVYNSNTKNSPKPHVSSSGISVTSTASKAPKIIKDLKLRNKTIRSQFHTENISPLKSHQKINSKKPHTSAAKFRIKPSSQTLRGTPSSSLRHSIELASYVTGRPRRSIDIMSMLRNDPSKNKGRFVTTAKRLSKNSLGGGFRLKPKEEEFVFLPKEMFTFRHSMSQQSIRGVKSK